MKAKHVKATGYFLGTLFAMLVYVAFLAVSWIAVCGVIKLITMCFDWTFSWAWASGIWLVMFLVRSVISHTITVKKG